MKYHFCHLLASVCFFLRTATSELVELRPDSSGLLGLVWMGPFFSGGSLSVESAERAIRISRLTEVKIVQHGLALDPVFVARMDPDVTRTLHLLSMGDVEARDAIVICDTESTFWHPSPSHQSIPCPPSESLFKVGRLPVFFEPIPSEYIQKFDQMDEIWVPSQLQIEILVSQGLPLPKLHIESRDFNSPSSLSVSSSSAFPTSSSSSDPLSLPNQNFFSPPPSPISQPPHHDLHHPHPIHLDHRHRQHEIDLQFLAHVRRIQLTLLSAGYRLVYHPNHQPGPRQLSSVQSSSSESASAVLPIPPDEL